MTPSPKDRVYAAAERISAERRPTVSTVRAAAGVSNADATRYLKEWSEERQAAGSRLAATPAVLLEASARLAGTAWAEASALADERHAAEEAVWAQERKDKDAEIAELVADLDHLTEEHDATVSGLRTQVEELQTQLAALSRELDQARAAEQKATAAAADAATKLAAATARDTALQAAYDALLARITPPGPDTINHTHGDHTANTDAANQDAGDQDARGDGSR
ncbi:DNA-binding protein [Arthrobacter globiformis]|uniref:DNA-binding protein n=1 Tax=Arthrobacter globiformis TaxID=1665 RepID=UPI00278287DB|nr:DNA-binding protein [Arthrobacter globiformis]MDQ0867451.1 chromosome segregation ATPase [Arthrobacter globiformis]